MKSKIKLIIMCIVAICVCGVISFFANNNIFESIIDVNMKYKTAAADIETQNNKMWQDKLVDDDQTIADLNAKIEEAKAKSTELGERIKEINNEMANKNNGNTNLEPLNSDLMYYKLVNVGLASNTDIDKFYSYEDGKYTFSLSGRLYEIERGIVKLNETLEDYVIDYGNISLRQNYDAYDLERTYDNGSLLTWYDNKIVNALGETIEIKDLVDETESDEEKEIDYTVDTLNEVKYDQEGYNMELLTSNSQFESKISGLTINYANQLSIIEKSDYSDEVKKELREKAEEQYNTDIEALKAAKQSAADAIKIKYDQKYENDKKAVSHAIRTYKEKIDQLKLMLADNLTLEYTLDITIRNK